MAEAIRRQVEIASAWAGDRPEDVDANEGAASAHQDLEIYGNEPPTPPPPARAPLSIAVTEPVVPRAPTKPKVKPLAWDEAESAGAAKQCEREVYLAFAALLHKSDRAAADTWRRVAARVQ